MRQRRTNRPTLIVLLFGCTVLAACGGGEMEPPAATVDNPADDAAACQIAVPDCDDPVGGAVVDGGLGIPEAVATDATGVIAVRGFLVMDDGGTRLCEALAESYPPQCAGASLTIGNPESIPGLDGFSTAQGVTWSDNSITLQGELTDGALTIDAESS